jgi:hypothetical protein
MSMVAALNAGNRLERDHVSAMTADVSRAVQRSAGNAAMVQMLRDSGIGRRESGPNAVLGTADRPVQRSPQGSIPAHGPGGSLDGLDSHGNYYKFDHRHVKAKRLADHQGVLIGISFPTQPGDVERVTAWAKQPRRTSDVEVYNVTVSGTMQQPIYQVGSAMQAPWSGRPLYIHAHASDQFFEVPVDVGTSGNPHVIKLKVYGDTFSTIVRRHPGFQEALRNNPGADGLLMSCLSGHPDATAAAELAKGMHDHGSRQTWYAPTGMGVRMNPLPGTEDASGYGSAQTWDAQGRPMGGGFVAFPPPRRTHGT